MASRLHRLIRIIRLVRGTRYPNVQELCHTLQVKERTLFNDLKELKEDLGVEIKFSRTHGGYYLEKNDVEVSFLTLNEESAFLLLAAFDLLAHYGGEALAEPLRVTFDDEICVALGDSLQRSRQRPAGILISRENQKFVGTNKELFTALCRACLKQEKVKLAIHNNSDNGVDESPELMEVTPCLLVLGPEQWRLAYKNGIAEQLEELDLSKIVQVI